MYNNMNVFYEEISCAFPVVCLSGRVLEDVYSYSYSAAAEEGTL